MKYHVRSGLKGPTYDHLRSKWDGDLHQKTLCHVHQNQKNTHQGGFALTTRSHGHSPTKANHVLRSTSALYGHQPQTTVSRGHAEN
jgi:hypothetical protein